MPVVRTVAALALSLALPARAEKIPLAAIYRGVAPYVVSNLVRLAVLLAVPALATWLPAALK